MIDARVWVTSGAQCPVCLASALLHTAQERRACERVDALDCDGRDDS